MEGTPKAIEMKGIVRNATKIGVQDGQAEDLINLRFVDGSWRASGNGRQIVNMPTGTIYQQLYVHTNIYHHLLGVDNGTLYWFAEIDNDGVTFYPLDNTTDRTQWPEDKQGLPTERKALTTVVGDVWITQTSHLLTVIDENDDFEHFVFKTSTKEYIVFNMDVNGNITDRSLYPFGQVHFNLYEPQAVDCQNLNNDRHFIYKTFNAEQVIETVVSNVKVALAEAEKKNLFIKPCLAVVAVKLYDGTFAYASNPVLIHTREMTNDGQSFYDDEEERLRTDSEYQQLTIGDNIKTVPTYQRYDEGTGNTYTETDDRYLRGIGADVDSTPKLRLVNYYSETHSKTFEHLCLIGLPSYESEKATSPRYASTLMCLSVNAGSSSERKPTTTHIIIQGSDLLLNLSNYDCIDGDIVKSLCVFITNPAEAFRYDLYKFASKNVQEFTGEDRRYCIYKYARRDNSAIMRDLANSPFYLLREYTSQELSYLKDNPTIDLTDIKYENILTSEILVQQKTLSTEAFARQTYIPKVSYMYNGRLHIANYKSHPFFGYPIDLFHLHNHSVKVQDGAWFKGVLPKLADNNDEYLQYPCAVKNFSNTAELIEKAAPVFIVKVFIETAQGEQVVTRYIQAYDTSISENGRADFIEDLNPLLTYPDARAYKMEIYYVNQYIIEPLQEYGRVYVKMRSFDLKPHPYLNMAYYFENDLKPIKLSTFTTINSARGENVETLKERVGMQNTEEYFPNGLKVSKTDNPMFFPVENTYQVGSAEILALMSNTIAVGTGQTGDAPLYVLCKDGVYALYVDSSGQMAYPNARILARDVCNNPRSVTPIDAGVVFTTDRGLMMIAGEQVQEIGAPAEGDVVQFWNAGSVDYSKIATASLLQIAGLPSNLCSTADFLTYLQDKGTSGKAAIINYNHNMRELMVSNPNYPYSYVLDREGNWSRRDYTAAQYVNNYPTSYRVDADGHFYKVDDEGDANTTLEHRKEADNRIFYLSNVIKLDSIGFKQAYRFVVRGYFETMFAGQDIITDTIYDRKIIVMGLSVDNMGIGEILRMAYLHIYGIDAWVSIGEHGEVGNILTLEIYDALTLENITNTFRPTGMPGEYITLIKTDTPERPAMACVVEGSYDGRKFKPLGYNRKSGKFRDIGCIVERTDVRFFRVCLSGQVTGKTRIDYMEMSAGASMLNTKIR